MPFAINKRIWNQYCNMFCCMQLILKPICSLLDGTCIILIISWLRMAFDFTLTFSFIPFWAPLLLLRSSALLVSVIFLLLPAPLVLLLLLPLRRIWHCCPCRGWSGKRHGNGSSTTAVAVGLSRAGRFVPWPCSFLTAGDGIEITTGHLRVLWLFAEVTSYSATVGNHLGLGLGFFPFVYRKRASL